MVVEVEAAILGDAVLSLLYFRIVELFNAPTLQTYEVIMVASLVELEYRATTFKVMALQQTRLFKLSQHTVNRGEADISTVLQQQFVDVLGRHVALFRILEEFEHLKAR